MALLGGIGGGMARDVLVNQVPGALTNPAYITLCLIAGVIGYRLAYGGGQLFREGLFQFMTSFSLPLYAIVGAQKESRPACPCWVSSFSRSSGPRRVATSSTSRAA